MLEVSLAHLPNTQTYLRYPADVAGDPKDELAQTALAPSANKPAVEDLGRTATAPPGAKDAPAAPIGATLGRYRLERQLGEGGMGVVHAAFDPDLERRVALKVLRTTDGDDAQKQRLQREAKAMARLAHPNVVTVHEVGTVGGRDYVAMELVEGESLAEWLRSTKRPEAEILDAFLAAGRGLAAAHAAGMVHRDFKPHNVLRSKSGRIAVTDFGLAREANADPYAVTGAASPKSISAKLIAKATQTDHTPSTPLAGLTMTGAVLGTPAYMAPEQWAGGTVTPATDQFAFCVALWEALSGERPFRADTVEMLRRAVELGPAPLDDSKIPRRLRPILRRGLDPAPSKRWPSMDVLLAEMAPPKRPALALIGGGIAVVGAATVYVLATRSPPAPPEKPIVACPAPALDPATIKPTGEPLAVKVLTADLERWKTAREKACALEPVARVTRVTCLDRVLSRLDAVTHAIAKLDAKAQPVDIGRDLIDPAVCEKSPRLEPVSPLLAETIAIATRDKASLDPLDPAVVNALLEKVGGDPCAGAWANMMATQLPDPRVRERHMTDAEQLAERCGDDRVRAEVAIFSAAYAVERVAFGMPKTSQLKVAAAAVERVAQADLVADVDSLRLTHAFRADNLDEAIVRGDAAMAGYVARGRIAKQLEIGLHVNGLRELRAEPADLVRVRELRTEFIAIAKRELGARHPMTRKLERNAAWQVFTDGDYVTAQQRLLELRDDVPLARKRKMTVRVLQAGKPVAGALVAGGESVAGGGTLAAFPMPEAQLRTGTTGANGEVTLEVAQDGLVIAQLGDLRSRAAIIADSVTLELEPTSRIEGTVDLRGTPSSRVIVAVSDTRNDSSLARYEMIAPVRPDGTFVIEGVPRAKLQLFTAMRIASARSVTASDLVVTAPVMQGVKLAMPGMQRTVHVIVRSTAATSGGAQAYIVPGTIKSTTLDKFRFDGNTAIRIAKPATEKSPAGVRATVKPGDVVAALAAPPKGAATACAIGLPAEIDDVDIDRKIRDNLKKIEVRCTPIPEGSETIVVEVPPWPRLE